MPYAIKVGIVHQGNMPPAEQHMSNNIVDGQLAFYKVGEITFAERELSIFGTGGKKLKAFFTILLYLLNALDNRNTITSNHFITCVHSPASEGRPTKQIGHEKEAGELRILRGDNIKAIQDSDIVMLGVDLADAEATLKQNGQEATLSKQSRTPILSFSAWIHRPILLSRDMGFVLGFRQKGLVKGGYWVKHTITSFTPVDLIRIML
ncbi:hypothetical protein P153DRAFT_386906 [Dothidotthia symphoricarpi CBS 119687]|uniref:Uncharacterized protein n=1 Tax=Dothidotthia symphoricarpi CBS 119687 TaxID=1392245 RepID=A0A6A6AAM0_9PLEO|nr:uncharacterized protein P153DRAFT_386906 [Dothidotthia symphoricarpi CBS 119687]KAF2127928.1 hypothetical protein P153DRAFT_386906 [Dothidotthia symphoricarpi CBS 119687]